MWEVLIDSEPTWYLNTHYHAVARAAQLPASESLVLWAEKVNQLYL